MGTPRTAGLHISVIVMAYNEVATLRSVVDEIDGALGGSDWRYEILIVDDGSSDGTGEVADVLARERPHVLAIHHEGNRGIGEVYRSGFGSSRGEYLTFLPADGQFPAGIVRQFAPLMANADLVLGHIPNRTGSVVAKLLSKAERLLYRLMFGPLPEFQGIMMFRRSLLDDLGVRVGGRGWGVLMELVVRTQRSGYRIVNVATGLRPRISGRSKAMSLRSAWANLKQAVALRRAI